MPRQPMPTMSRDGVPRITLRLEHRVSIEEYARLLECAKSRGTTIKDMFDTLLHSAITDIDIFNPDNPD